MNLLFRLLKLFLTYRFRKRLDFFEEGSLNFRVLPSDIDLNFHINNGVYFSMMDLGRYDLIFRTGGLKKLQEEKIYALVASQTIRYMKPLNLFQKFTIKSQATCWDEKFFYITQKFISKNQLCALATVKVRFIKKNIGGIRPQKFVDILANDLMSPPIPPHISNWTQAEADSLNEAN